MLEILAFGVTLEYLDRAKERGIDVGGTRNTRESVAESYTKAKPQFDAIKNVNWTLPTFNPDDPKCFQDFLDVLKSKKYDAITIGGGLRTIPELSSMFTNIVNAAKKEHPDAILAFPLLPHEVIPSLKAQIPDLS